MMKLKYLDFRNGEYKLYEDYLNDLDLKGYELSAYDYYARIITTKEHYQYKVILFQKELNGISKRTQISNLIDKYTNQGYKFCGRYKKMFIFRTSGKTTNDVENCKLLINSDKINRIVFLILSIILLFFMIFNVTNNNDVSNYLTNGLIIFHYMPIMMCLVIFYRFAYKAFLTFFKKDLKVNMICNKIFTVSFTVLILLSLSSLILDNMERSEGDIKNYSDSEVSFKTFQKEPTYSRLTYKNSLIVSKSTTLMQENKTDTLSLQKYTFDDSSTCDKFFTSEIKDEKKHLSKNSKIIKYSKDTYIVKSNDKVYGLYQKKDKSYQCIDTTFDMSKKLKSIVKGNLE